MARAWRALRARHASSDRREQFPRIRIPGAVTVVGCKRGGDAAARGAELDGPVAPGC